MEKPNIESCSKDVIKYIEYLESIVQGSSRLLRELNLVCDTCANDLELIRTGSVDDGETNLSYIKSDKNDQTFTRMMVLVSKIDDFKAIEKLTNSYEKIEETTEETKTIPKDVGNVFEFVSKKVLNKQLNGK